jgi:hypothetical protein
MPVMYFVTNTAIVCHICGNAYASRTTPQRDRRLAPSISTLFTCNGPTNAVLCNKTLTQMSHIKTLKITPTCFDHQVIIIRELLILVKSLVQI